MRRAVLYNIRLHASSFLVAFWVFVGHERTLKKSIDCRGSRVWFLGIGPSLVIANALAVLKGDTPPACDGRGIPGDTLDGNALCPPLDKDPLPLGNTENIPPPCRVSRVVLL